jgi:hypothetical protein
MIVGNDGGGIAIGEMLPDNSLANSETTPARMLQKRLELLGKSKGDETHVDFVHRHSDYLTPKSKSQSHIDFRRWEENALCKIEN